MTVIMRKDIREEKILQIPASSSYGDGSIYITSKAVIYEVDGMGIYLNFIPREIIVDFHASESKLFGTRKFCIIWMEDNAKHGFEFRTKQHKRLQDVLLKFSNRHDLSSPARADESSSRLMML